MRKTITSVFIVFLLLSSLVLFLEFHQSYAQTPNATPPVAASPYVNGIITSDTVWTKANSPYIFAGNVLVNNGATLTIEPDVIIYLNDYYLKVNGTLNAQGTNTGKIHFISNGTSLWLQIGVPGNGVILFSSTSTDWNEQTSSGCILENAVISSTQGIATVGIYGASPKISKCTITNTGGQRSILIQGEAPVISGNSITSNNEGITFLTGANSGTVSDNIIYGCQVGIEIYGGTPIIERNLITDNTGSETSGSGGIRIDYAGTSPLIRNNTIVKNSVGFNLLNSPSPIILNNNIQDNSKYSIYLYSGSSATSNDINAAYNWWGTTDTIAINQTIRDKKNDFNLGTVNYIPFLNAPNPAAPTQLPEPTPTPTSPPLHLLQHLHLCPLQLQQQHRYQPQP